MHRFQKKPAHCARTKPGSRCGRPLPTSGRVTWLATLLAALPAIAATDDDLSAAFDRDVLIVEASAHACYRFDVYLALSPEQRRRGLMFVRELPATTGMLFIYDGDDYGSMWMKNTYISLDIVFARADGRVSSIAHDTEPLSLRSIVSTEPIRYVLELNAGITKKLSIDENSRLLWSPVHDHAGGRPR